MRHFETAPMTGAMGLTLPSSSHQALVLIRIQAAGKQALHAQADAHKRLPPPSGSPGARPRPMPLSRSFCAASLKAPTPAARPHAGGEPAGVAVTTASAPTAAKELAQGEKVPPKPRNPQFQSNVLLRMLILGEALGFTASSPLYEGIPPFRAGSMATAPESPAQGFETRLQTVAVARRPALPQV